MTKDISIEEDPFKIYPHLAELKKEAEDVAIHGTKYWQLRCMYLEKHLDETYSQQERDNCYMLYRILVYRKW